MKKNLYFRHVVGRKNVIAEVFLNFVHSISSFPRLLIEVFIRRNFGERYYNFVAALTIASLLCIYPFISDWVLSLFRPRYYRYGVSKEWTEIIWQYWSWYLFLFLFYVKNLQHKRDMERAPSVFDFGRYSLYSGDFNPTLYSLMGNSANANARLYETIVEPLPFFFGGFFLAWTGQSLGYLLMLSSVLYSLSYVAAYRKGDNFVMDKIDEMIMNEELEKAFVDDLDPTQTRGIRFYGRKPTSDDLRRKLSESFTEDDEKGTSSDTVEVS